MAQQRLILNKYLPIKEIGSGGFGTVYVAKDMLVQRLVAIKTIELTELDAQRAAWVREDMAREAQVEAVAALDSGRTTLSLITPGEEDELASSLEERYLANIPGLDEARTAAALSDPTIVTVYDCQISGNMVYLVMEYVEGVTLTKLLADHGDQITLDVVASVFESIAHALEVAHAHGVLHLDIKPDNVLIDPDGNVKVTDFGLATLIDANGQGTANAGTIGYMPLEQMRQQPLDARTDQWALASITYEMLTGKNPFLAPTLDAAEKLLDGAELTLAARCWDDLPDEADDALFQALDPDVEDRFASVADFADELGPCLGDSEVGKRVLAALVQGEDPDEEGVYGEDTNIMDPDDPDGDGRKFFKGKRNRREPGQRFSDRFSDFQKTAAARAFAALGAALVAALGAWNIAQLSGLSNPLFWAFSLVPAVIAAILPGVGALLAYVVLSAALLMNKAYVLGGIMLVGAGLWWWFAGRGGKAAANAALSFPLFSSFGLAAVPACLAGYCASVPRALITVIFGSYVTLVCAAFGSMDLMSWNGIYHLTFADDTAGITARAWDLTTDLGTWCLIISWVLAAVALSLCAKPRRRWLCVIGAILAFALVMIGVWCHAQFVPEAISMIPSATNLIRTVIAGALVLFVCVGFDPPVRPLPKVAPVQPITPEEY